MKNAKSVKNKARLGNNFQFKDQIPKDLISGVVYKSQLESTIIPIMLNMLDMWMQELVNILVYHHKPKIKVSLKKNSVPNHLLFSNHSVFLDEFSVATRENKVRTNVL